MCPRITNAQHDISMDMTAIDKMTRQEKLQAMEALWDALTHEPTDPASPGWHAETLARRRQKIENATASFVTLEQLKNAPGT